MQAAMESENRARTLELESDASAYDASVKLDGPEAAPANTELGASGCSSQHILTSRPTAEGVRLTDEEFEAMLE